MKKRILIAGDNPELLKSYFRALCREYHVSCVETPATAYYQATTSHWDLVISDYDFGPRKIKGVALASLIKSDTPGRKIAIYTRDPDGAKRDAKTKKFRPDRIFDKAVTVRNVVHTMLEDIDATD